MTVERIQPNTLRALSAILLNVWTGCCAVALSEQTRLLLGQPAAFGALEGFVFGGALFAYNIIRVSVFMRGLGWGFGALALVCLLQLPYLTQCAAIVPFVAWGLYYGALGLVRVRLRAVPLLKPLTVALVWAWVTVLLPLTSGPWLTAGILFAGRAAFLFGLALSCDLCDWEIDRQFGLDTLARRLGRFRSLFVVFSSLAASAVCVTANAVLGYYEAGPTLALLTSLAITAIVLPVILRYVRGAQTQKALIDAQMLLQFVTVLLYPA